MPYKEERTLYSIVISYRVFQGNVTGVELTQVVAQVVAIIHLAPLHSAVSSHLAVKNLGAFRPWEFSNFLYEVTVFVEKKHIY